MTMRTYKVWFEGYSTEFTGSLYEGQTAGEAKYAAALRVNDALDIGVGDLLKRARSRFVQRTVESMPDLPEREIDVMLHALGVTQTPRRRDMGWRNYFLAGAQDIEPWESLISKGLAVRNGRDATCYHVSPAGLKLLGVTEKS